MRDIKFRAWGKLSHTMKPWEELSKYDYLTDAISNPNYILMQYTCLKDKNGKEIYEGDIVKDVNDEYYEIKFDDGCFIVIHDGNVIEPLSEVAQDIEIIGNIYENPELLEK